MTISCGCNDVPEPGELWAWHPEDYSTYGRKRRTRCCSCGRTIAAGDTVAEFQRYKVAKTEIEERIYGDDGEVPRASKFHCERCADLWFSICELGYCADYEEDMRAQAKQVAEAIKDAELRQALQDIGLNSRVRAASRGVELRRDPPSGMLCELGSLFPSIRRKWFFIINTIP